MIAEDAQPPARGREPRHLSGATHDTFRAPAVDSPAGPTGRLSAGQAAAGLEGGVECAAAALKPRMRGWLHAGMFPLALAGGIVLIAVSRSAAAVAACSVYAVSALLLFGTSAVMICGFLSVVVRRRDVSVVRAGFGLVGRLSCGIRVVSWMPVWG